ncbi:MAG: hypothetical protein ABIY52_09080 [Gemmatimonadaceae bacterium]
MHITGGARFIIGMTLAAFVVSCGDKVGGPQPTEACTGTCVPSFDVNPHHLLITVGDTARFVAKARTADGATAMVTWVARAGTTGNIPISLDGAGLARGIAAGRGFVDAHSPNEQTAGGGRAEIWVVSPDTAAQPFIALYRDAASGDTIPYLSPFVGRDSIDIVISYVIGNFTNAPTPPTLRFQVRIPGTASEVFGVTMPAPVRGKAATTTLRLNLRQRTALGAPVFEQRTYEFYVLLPLADGRILGDQTPYPVVF